MDQVRVVGRVASAHVLSLYVLLLTVLSPTSLRASFSGSPQFESWKKNSLHSMTIFVISFSPYREKKNLMVVYLQIGNDHFLSCP